MKFKTQIAAECSAFYWELWLRLSDTGSYLGMECLLIEIQLAFNFFS